MGKPFASVALSCDEIDIDGGDFLKWQRGESPSPLSPADFDAWSDNFGTEANPLATSATIAPEPNALLLGAWAALGLLICGKRLRR